MKIIAFIAAILSAATVATLAFTTVPSIQKQVEDNAEAIESIDNSVDGLNTRVETLEDKKLYLHNIYLTDFNLGSSTYSVRLTIYSNNSSPFTFNDLLNFAETWRLPCTGNFKVSSNTYQAISIGKVTAAATTLSLTTFPEIAPFQISSDKTLTDTIIEL